MIQTMTETPERVDLTRRFTLGRPAPRSINSADTYAHAEHLLEELAFVYQMTRRVRMSLAKEEALIN